MGHRYVPLALHVQEPCTDDSMAETNSQPVTARSSLKKRKKRPAGDRESCPNEEDGDGGDDEEVVPQKKRVRR